MAKISSSLEGISTKSVTIKQSHEFSIKLHLLLKLNNVGIVSETCIKNKLFWSFCCFKKLNTKNSIKSMILSTLLRNVNLSIIWNYDFCYSIQPH